MRPTLALVAAAIVLLLAVVAAAEPSPCPDAERCLLRLPDGAQTPGGIILPPGYYLTPETYQRLDDEVRRLQEAETRLQAERDTYRNAAHGRGWVIRGIVTSAFISGIIAGIIWQRQR